MDQRACTGAGRLSAENVSAKRATAEQSKQRVVLRFDRVERAVAQHDATGGFAEIDVAAEERRAYGALGLQPTDELLDEIAAIVQKAWWDGAVVTPGVVDTLEELRRRGLRLGLCSNAPYRPASLHSQIAHLGLARRGSRAILLSPDCGRPDTMGCAPFFLPHCHA